MGKRKRTKVSEQLRQIILSADESQYAICKACDIDKSHLSRFLHDRGSLSLRMVDRIAEHLDLELRRRG